MNLLFIGPSGSGKDTQAEILAKKRGMRVVGTGEMFRQEVAAGSPLGLEAKGYMDAGKWVPDELTYRMLTEHLRQHGADNIIFTGVVRTLEQIPMLDDTLAQLGAKLDKVLYFELSDDEVIKRLSNRWYCPIDGSTYHTIFKPEKQKGICDQCGGQLIQREDDKPEGVKGRLAEIHRTMLPIVEQYERRGVLTRINARPSIEEISATIDQLVVN